MAGFDPAIPPGGLGTVTAKATAAGGGARWSKAVILETNDPRNPKIPLRFTYRGRSPLEVTPAPAVNLSVARGEPAAASLVVRRPDGEPLEMEAVVAGSPRLQIACERAAPDGGEWTIRVALADTTTPRVETAILTLRTNHPLQPELSVPVRMAVRP